MQYVRLKEAMKDFTVFSLRDIRRVDPGFYRARLNEWQEKGYIKKIIKGHYLFSDVEMDEHALFEIANRIYHPSYVSFEMALSYHHLIPENPYVITSASTRRTYRFSTPVGEFHYRTLKPDLFFGYELVPCRNRQVKAAGIEKAVLDYFYANPAVKKEPDFASLRIDPDVFHERVDREKLFGQLGRFAQKALDRRVRSFMQWMEHA